MRDTLAATRTVRGTDLLLAHCAALTASPCGRRSAQDRLEQALGGELARMLVVALVCQPRRTLAA